MAQAADSKPTARPTTRTPSLAAALAAALVAAATLVVFAPVRDADFVSFDDEALVLENPIVRSGFSLRGARSALLEQHEANWMPMTWLSYMLDVELFGLDPRGFHLMSLLLHAANAALLFGLLRSATGALAPALAAALLFALHPLRVESVAWIAERKDVLSLFFGLLALGAYLRWTRRRRPGDHLAAGVLLLLGLAAKPTLVVLPLLMLALDFWPLGRLPLRRPGSIGRSGAPREALRRLLREKTLWLALCGAVAIVTVLAQHAGGSVPDLRDWGLGDRLARPVWAAAAYLGKALWPSDLAAFHPARARPLLSAEVLGAAALLAAVTALAATTARSRPWLAFGWLWYLAALAPVSGIVPFGAQDLAERHTYLPLIGPAVAAATELVRWAAPGRVRSAAAALVTAGLLLVMAGATRANLVHWRDSEALYARMLALDPGNELAAYGFGHLAMRAGDLARAERHLAVAARGRLFRYEALSGLGDIALAAGRRGEAAARYAEALELRPHDRLRRMRLGALLLELDRPAEAIGHLEALVRAEPGMAEARNNLGVALAQLGRLADAEHHLRLALELDPRYAAARANLEAVLAARGTAAPR